MQLPVAHCILKFPLPGKNTGSCHSSDEQVAKSSTDCPPVVGQQGAQTLFQGLPPPISSCNINILCFIPLMLC